MAKVGSHNIFFKKKKAAITFSHGSREVQTVLILVVVVEKHRVLI
jgi:predicted RNA binding protein YcfA (HicA-like mRNA interferase family)